MRRTTRQVHEVSCGSIDGLLSRDEQDQVPDFWLRPRAGLARISPYTVEFDVNSEWQPIMPM
jgi:hypothetical protein